MLSLLLSLALAAETRETFDANGRISHQQVIDAGVIKSETDFTYDADGQLVAKRTLAGTSDELHAWTYDKKGHEVTHEVRKDGVLASVTRTTWDGDSKASVAVTSGGATTVTSWTYDPDGHVLESQTTSGDGAVASSYKATFERPVVPIEMSVGGGVAYQTDVDLLAVNGSFSVTRKPAVERFGSDPFQVGASVSYAYGRSKGAVVNNQFGAHFGIDLNLVAPRTTPFLFVDVARNPVFNQNIDLQAAPVGVKFDLVPRDVMKLDFSLAPVLNYRSIFLPGTPADGATPAVADSSSDFFKLRASFRFRLGYDGGNWAIGDTIEYLPALASVNHPELAEKLTFAQSLAQDSILRNTFKISFNFTKWMSFSNQFVFTRDPTLAAQADCAADPEQLLCVGMVIYNQSNLNFSWKVKR